MTEKRYTREQIEKASKRFLGIQVYIENILNALDKEADIDTPEQSFVEKFVENRGTRGHTFIEKAKEEAQLIEEMVNDRLKPLQDKIELLMNFREQWIPYLVENKRGNNE